jgi:acetyltransferase-like isoleucine patch superfamily enzyme/lysophospholipase L1-like esterase
MKEKILKHKNICIYGFGNAFSHSIEKIGQLFPINYLTDDNYRKLVGAGTNVYKISPDDLLKIEDLFVIITTSLTNYLKIKEGLDKKGIPNCLYREITELQPHFPVVQLSKIDNYYSDHLGNVIEVDPLLNVTNDSLITFGREGSGFQAQNNRLEIGFGFTCLGSLEINFLRENSRVVIGNKSGIVQRMKIILDRENLFEIGSNSSFEEFFAVLFEGGTIKIGRNCMFSNHIELYQTDTHPIFDLESGNRININKNIFIGNHVWVGTRTSLFGGANIPNGSILGANTVTSSKFSEEKTIIAGNPAKVIRKNINWEFDELRLQPINNILDTKKYSTLRKANVYFLGDEFISRGSWDAIKNFESVLNLGIQWCTISDILDKSEAIILFKPKVICLMIGFSDFILNPRAIVEKKFSELIELVEKFHRSNIKLIIHTVLEFSSSQNDALLSKLKFFNSLIIRYCLENNITVFDINEILSFNGLINNDFIEKNNLHINSNGYETWERKLIEFVR